MTWYFLKKSCGGKSRQFVTLCTSWLTRASVFPEAPAGFQPSFPGSNQLKELSKYLHLREMTRMLAGGLALCLGR